MDFNAYWAGEPITTAQKFVLIGPIIAQVSKLKWSSKDNHMFLGK